MMKKGLLESCVDSVESALEAAGGGADRLELCAGLVIGGITPTPAVYEEIRKYSDIPINVLIRPRFGDFCYTDHEVEVIASDIRTFKSLGANGAVIGALCPDGSLDQRAMEKFMSAADGMSVTLHRAFDMCRDPFTVLEQSKRLGINTILTSGQEDSCSAGKELIRLLVEQAGDEIDILVGGGVSAEVIRELCPYTKATSFHMSGKVNLESTMRYRKQNVHMGIPGLSEYEIYRTSADKIRSAKKVLTELAG